MPRKRKFAQEAVVEEEAVEEEVVEEEAVEEEAEEEDEVAAQFRLTMQEWAEQEEARRQLLDKHPEPELSRCQMLKDRASRTDWSKWQNWQ